MNFFAYLLPGLSLLLEAVLTVLLLRGPYRRHPLLLLYCCAQLVRFGADGLAYSSAGVNSGVYRAVYWTGDVAEELLLFVIVTALTRSVLEGNPILGGVKKLLTLIPAVAAALPFVLFHPYFTGAWFRHTSQLLGLGAAFMNLLLWTGILGQKGRRDHQLLTVSAGLGIAVTGMAIAYGLLQFMSSASLRWLPDLLKGSAQVAGVAIWCWAFRPSAVEPKPSPAMVEHA